MSNFSFGNANDLVNNMRPLKDEKKQLLISIYLKLTTVFS
jgi:hypothetical protein